MFRYNLKRIVLIAMYVSPMWFEVGLACGQQKGHATSLNMVRFERDSDVACLKSAVETGDPSTGPSTVVLEVPQHCVIPWHYHSAEEQLIVSRGVVLTEMGSDEKVKLGPGGFAVMPGGERHQFTCSSHKMCILFVTFNGKYDIFWVH